MTAKLSDKQQKFVEHYLVHLNASKAALEAGYSPKTAHRSGQENLQKPAIKSRIDLELSKRSERTQISADQVLTELALIAFSDITEFISFDGDDVVLKDLQSMPQEARRCISKITQKATRDGTNVTIQLYDKLSALEKLEKHLPMHLARLTELEAMKLEYEKKLLDYKQQIGFVEHTSAPIEIYLTDGNTPDKDRNAIEVSRYPELDSPDTD